MDSFQNHLNCRKIRNVDDDDDDDDDDDGKNNFNSVLIY